MNLLTGQTIESQLEISEIHPSRSGPNFFAFLIPKPTPRACVPACAAVFWFWCYA